VYKEKEGGVVLKVKKVFCQGKEKYEFCAKKKSGRKVSI
jgi:hypothetical protein